MEEIIDVVELGSQLLVKPAPGAATDYRLADIFIQARPNVQKGWSHVVPALAKFSKHEGKQSIVGRDKGATAHRKVVEKLRRVVVGLYADGLVAPGTTPEDCLRAVLQSLLIFKSIYPNWMDAYSAAVRILVEQRESLLPILAEYQVSVEEG